METLRTVLVSLAGYDDDVVQGHVIMVEVAPDGERSSAELRVELPYQERQDDAMVWARRVLAAAVAEL